MYFLSALNHAIIFYHWNYLLNLFIYVLMLNLSAVDRPPVRGEEVNFPSVLLTLWLYDDSSLGSVSSISGPLMQPTAFFYLLISLHMLPYIFCSPWMSPVWCKSFWIFERSWGGMINIRSIWFQIVKYGCILTLRLLAHVMSFILILARNCLHVSTYKSFQLCGK